MIPITPLCVHPWITTLTPIGQCSINIDDSGKLSFDLRTSTNETAFPLALISVNLPDDVSRYNILYCSQLLAFWCAFTREPCDNSLQCSYNEWWSWDNFSYCRLKPRLHRTRRFFNISLIWRVDARWRARYERDLSRFFWANVKYFYWLIDRMFWHTVSKLAQSRRDAQAGQ